MVTRDQPSRLRIFDGRDYETSLTDICDRSLAHFVRNRFHEMIFKQLNWPFNFHWHLTRRTSDLVTRRNQPENAAQNLAGFRQEAGISFVKQSFNGMILCYFCLSNLHFKLQPDSGHKYNIKMPFKIKQVANSMVNYLMTMEMFLFFLLQTYLPI